MAANLNFGLETPVKWTKIWPGAVGALTQVYEPLTFKACRIIVVGRVLAVPAALVIEQADDSTVTFTDTDLLAHGYVLLGQWARVLAVGSSNVCDLWCGI